MSIIKKLPYNKYKQFVECEWEIEYLPVGFALHDTFEAGEIKFFEYVDDEGVTIDFSYVPSIAATYIDNTDRIYSVIIENGNTYYLFTSEVADEENVVIWDMNGYRFKVASLYSIDELTKIAFSVKTVY